MDPLLIIDELGSYRSVERTPSGGWAVPATLTRTGIFKYVEGGKTIHVLRPAEEVFSDASLATLAHLPVTVYHPAEREVTPKNYRRVVVGHLDKGVPLAGKYIAGRLRIEDEDTGAKIDTRELCEVSMGYYADYALNDDGTYVSGTYNGEHYDRVQKNIRYNHVSIGPKGWGRAGSDVGIKLDGGTDYVTGMTNLQASLVVNDDAGTPAPPAAPIVDAAAVAAERDREQARADMLQLQVNELLAAAQKTPAAPVVDHAAVAARTALVADAKVLAPTLNCDALTDEQIRTEAVKTVKDVTGKSAAYIHAAFDLAVEHRKSVVDSHAQVASVVRAPIVATDSGPDPLMAAYEANAKAYGKPAAS